MDSFFSKYGFFVRKNPFAKEFYVLASSNSLYGEYSAFLTPDKDGVQRLHATLASALAVCVASRGDIIHVLPGHTESFAAVQALSVAGVTLIGYGTGSLKPTFTVTTAADVFSFTAANVTVDNFHIAAPGIDEATAMINVAAAGATIRNLTGIGSTTSINYVDCITLAAGADDCTLENIKINNTTVAVNSFINIEAAVARLRLSNVYCFGDVATAGIIDAATATQIYWDNVHIGVVGSSKPAATLDSNPTGFIRNSNFAGTSTTLAANAALGTGVRLFDVKVLEETGGAAQGALIPAVDSD